LQIIQLPAQDINVQWTYELSGILKPCQ
jgi:hypothetical protein